MRSKQCVKQSASKIVLPELYQVGLIFPPAANISTIFTLICDSEFMTQNGVEHGVTETIGSDKEFDPIGTLTLIGIYFVILLLAWVYIYYIEFLGRDLVVVG